MKLKLNGILAAVTLFLGILTFAAPQVGAIDVFKSCGGQAGGSSVCGAKDTDKADNILKNVINTLLYILGIIAVIMIVIGGIRYTTSNGDASNIKSAKDTILYAVVGLVVAILAFAIVNFVVTSFGGK